MTPYLIGRIIGAKNERAAEEFKADRWLCWHMAAMTRAKKMPSLKEFIGITVQRKGINEAEIKARLMAYNDKSR